jgi:hypothetical protein
VQKLSFLGNVLYKNYFCQKVISQTCLRQPVFLSLIVFLKEVCTSVCLPSLPLCRCS